MNNGGGAIPATPYGQVTTIAGSGALGYVNATGTTAQFNIPYTMVGDAAGNLYVADASNNAIRMITPTGVVSTFAGSDVAGNTGDFVNATGTSALFNSPQGIAIDGAGNNLYVADFGNNAIREINIANGVVTTFFTQAGLAPTGMSFDASGNLLVATQGLLSQIMSISPLGVLTSLAGSQFGYINATGAAAQFADPEDVQQNAAGNIFVADYLNNAIREITPAGVVTTFAGSDVANNTGSYADGVGTAARFNNPTGIAIGSGNVIYVADLYNNDIRKILPDGTVSLVAGSATQTPGAADGTGTAASFNQPVDLYIDGTGTGYVADAQNGDIRKIILTGYTIDKPLPAGLSFDQTTGTISGTPTGSFTGLSFTVTGYNTSGYSSTIITLSTTPAGFAPVIAYAPSTNSITIGTPFTITPTNTGGIVPATVYGQVTTLAGSGTPGYNNNTGTAAQFNIPYTMVSDALGNLYVADEANNAIREVTPGGVVTTFAGSLSGAHGNVNATGTAALFYSPQGIAIDGAGNLYVADFNNNAIRKITPGGVVTTFFTQAGLSPTGISFDASGNLLVATQGLLSQIMSISPSGVLTSLAGNVAGYANGTGAGASFNLPEDAQADASGNIFVADYLNNAIRKIAPGNVVTTFAGSNVANNTGSYADGVGTAARFNNPTGIAIGSGNVIYVADLYNNAIRRILPDGTVSLVAGDASQAPGAADGIGSAASFNAPVDLYIDGTGTGYVADANNGMIRKINLTGYSIDKPLPAGLTFDSTTGTISGTLTVPLIGTTYNVTAYNAYGYSTTPVTLSSYNNWTGGTTDWATASNWSQNQVPAAGNVAQIGIVPYTAGTAQPELTASTTVGSVRFGTNNTPVLTIDATQTLTVTDSLTVVTASTAIINGPGTISLGGTSVINPTASLTAALNAVIALAPAATLTNNGTFTLASDVNGSSSIAAIPAGASITGNINVQRFIQGNNDINKRGYRLISSAVFTGNDGTSNVFDLQYLTNSVYVSGVGYAGNGFNVTSTENPSLYLFREDATPPPSNSTIFTTGYNWKGVAKINNTPAYNIGTQTLAQTANVLDTTTTIPVGNGILFFFRGDLTQAVTPISPPHDVTLTQTGTLNTGTVNVRLWFSNAGNGLGNNFSYTPGNIAASTLTAGFTLVGNPYPSTINWEKYNMNGANSSIYGGGGLSTTIYVFDVVNKQYEAYIPALEGDTTSIIPVNATASGPAASNMIASGQGFFVLASAPGQTLSFRETAKMNTQPVAASVNMLMGMPKQLAAAAPKPSLHFRLLKDSINTDEIVIRLDNNAKSKFIINEDALDLGGSGSLVSLSSISTDSIKLAINTLPFPGQQQQVIPLLADATASGSYQLVATQLNNLPALYDVWLKDAFTADSVQMKLNTNYQFSIDKSNPATFGSTRFTLVIRQDPALAYQLLSFTGSKMPTAPEVQLVWKTVNEQNYTNFTVERSIDDGKSFDVLGGLQGTGAGTYSLLDKNPVTGQNQYRLKQEDINNTITYSKVVTIQYSDLSNNNLDNLNLFPNPASSAINLAIIATPDETATYNIKFVNSSGLVVKEVNSSQPTWQGNISSLKPGTYFVRVFSNKDQSLVGRTKFVKL